MIIVGGGPAGLQCARELAHSELRVLLLEKKEVFGDKLCAGGLTLKDMEVLPLPDQVIQQKISRAAIHSRRRTADSVTPVPYIFTLDRRTLGDYQRSLLDGTKVEVMTGSQVTGIEDHQVILKNGESYGFRYLVGADGYASVVRRHVGLKAGKKLMGYQYTLRAKKEHTQLEMFLDARRFHLWYAWIFPHGDTLAVGCCFDPDRIRPQKVADGFQQWLKERGLETDGARLESCPIACDYRGYRFDHVFLTGEAAGLASAFTGEGIYQALVSGQEVARLIMDPDHRPESLNQVLRYNRTLERMMKVFHRAGPLRGAMQELFVFLMSRDWVRDRINNMFSSSD